MLKKAHFALSCMVGFSVLGCAGMDQGKLRAQWKGKAAPDFELASLDGGKVKLSHFKGKPVVLAFWAFG